MKITNSARVRYYRDAIQSAGSDSNGLWGTVKKHFYTSVQRLDSATALKRAQSFLSFFTDKVVKIASDIASEICNHPCPPLSPPSAPSSHLSSFDAVTCPEVSRLIHDLSPSKSSPIDIIPVSLIKSCSPLFSYLISELANRSFEEGIFPSSFKTAQITPILKKPSLDPEDPSSYRPISNLRTISKLLKRLVHSRLAQHLTT